MLRSYHCSGSRACCGVWMGRPPPRCFRSAHGGRHGPPGPGQRIPGLPPGSATPTRSIERAVAWRDAGRWPTRVWCRQSRVWSRRCGLQWCAPRDPVWGWEWDGFRCCPVTDSQGMLRAATRTGRLCRTSCPSWHGWARASSTASLSSAMGCRRVCTGCRDDSTSAGPRRSWTFSQRVRAGGLAHSLGSVGDAFDNALVEFDGDPGNRSS